MSEVERDILSLTRIIFKSLNKETLVEEFEADNLGSFFLLYTSLGLLDASNHMLNGVFFAVNWDDDRKLPGF